MIAGYYILDFYPSSFLLPLRSMITRVALSSTLIRIFNVCVPDLV